MSTDRLPQGRPPARARRRSNIYGRTAESEQTGGYRNANMFKSTCTPDRMYWDDKADKTAEVVTTFRLLPEFGADGSFYPARELNDQGLPDLSAWIDRYYCFKLPGAKGRPGGGYIVFDPDDMSVDLGRVRFENPASMILQGIKNAMKAEEGGKYWGYLVHKENRDRIEWPNWNYFSYALMYGRGEKERHDPPNGLRPGDKKPVVLHMNKQVGEGITRIVNLTREGMEGVLEGALDPDAALDDYFEAPDPVDLRAGLLFRAFMIKGKNPLKALRAAEDEGRKVPWYLDVPRGEDETAGKVGYDVFAMQAATLRGARDEPDMKIKPAVPEVQWEALARRHAMPIRDHLLFPDQAEQVRLLVEHIRKPDGGYCGDLFRYVFQDQAELIDVVESSLGHVEARTRTFDPASREDRRAVRNGAPAAAEVDEADEPARAPAARRPSRAPVRDESGDDAAYDARQEDEAGDTAPPAESRGPSRRAAARRPAEPAEVEDTGEDDLDDLDEVDEVDEQDGGPEDPVEPEDDEPVDEAEDADEPDEVDEPVAATPARAARPVGRDGQPLRRPAASAEAPWTEPPAPVRQPAPATPPRSGKEKLEELKRARLGAAGGKN